nr:MAG: hypothetical protein DIU61_18750 [Bacteroidota bacterium]
MSEDQKNNEIENQNLNDGLSEINEESLEVRKAPGNIEVIHGAYNMSLPLAGSKISEIRAEAAEELNIPADAEPSVDGQPVGEDYVVQEGQRITFVKHAGEKGAAV